MRVAVLHGGRSSEHAVSLASAESAIGAVAAAGHEAVPVLLERNGAWLGPDGMRLALDPGAGLLGCDVAFPVLHGPYGEDGTVQGLLELANVAYVGSGVLGSAAGMDKAVMKVLFRAAGLLVPDWVVIWRRDWESDPGQVTARIEAALAYPLFVKPANLGSSVGISKVHDRSELAPALDAAAGFDRKIVVEAAVPEAREIECAVLGNADPRASIPGEIVPGSDFYDYDDKYVTDAADLLVPADLDDGEVAEVQSLAIAAYRALRVDGMARADFFYERDGRGWLLNELNTIPGFTPISQYPKLWEASGLPYGELVDELGRLAIERPARRSRLSTKR